MNELAERWDRFWFAPAATSTIAVFRIAYGVIVLLWATALSFDASTFFSPSGVLPSQSSPGLRWGLFAWLHSSTAVTVLLVALFASAVCVIAGYHSRLATAATFVLLVSFTRRNPWVFNSGDALIRNFGLFLALAPSGAALSVDRWRATGGDIWRFPLRAPWALRLIQVQVSFVYLFTVWAKARGAHWIAGTAVAESLRVGDIVRFKIPYGVTNSLLLANLLTYGTLLIELSLAILIWNRKLRPYVIAGGIALHLFIELTFALGFFSMIMIASYIAFVPEDAMSRRLADVRRRLGHSKIGGLRRLGSAGAAPLVASRSPAPVGR